MAHPHRLVSTVARLRQNDAAGRVAFVPEFMTAEECDRVIALSETAQVHVGATDREAGGAKVDTARDSSVRFLFPSPETKWIFDRLEYGLLRLNERYQFDLTGFFQGCQVATYSAGGHYDWHMDLGPGVNSTRKLSLSIQLSNADDYEGGDLQFIATDERGPRERGSLIAFPSFLVHRVTPVTSGSRISLVSWISGDPFR